MPRPKRTSSSYWIYGLHAVGAALQNPDRHINRIVLTENAAKSLAEALENQDVQELNPRPQPKITSRDAIDALLESDAVHQGAAAEVRPLPQLHFQDILEPAKARAKALLVVLDQVTDPQNVGAIIRSAAGFGATGLIVQDRHAPPETGALAKAASGALETLPMARVGNLAAALKEMAEAGFWRIGLTGHSDRTLADLPDLDRAALVMGAEGQGLRRLTAENCDFLARIPLAPTTESLNVSNAAAIALYELATKASMELN